GLCADARHDHHRPTRQRARRLSRGPARDARASRRDAAAGEHGGRRGSPRRPARSPGARTPLGAGRRGGGGRSAVPGPPLAPAARLVPARAAGRRRAAGGRRGRRPRLARGDVLAAAVLRGRVRRLRLPAAARDHRPSRDPGRLAGRAAALHPRAGVGAGRAVADRGLRADHRDLLGGDRPGAHGGRPGGAARARAERPAHRSGQLSAPLRPHELRDRPPPAQRIAVRAARHGSRRLQGRQRRARPSGRRPAAEGDRRRAHEDGARAGHRGATGRRRVRGAGARDRRGGGRRAGDADRARARRHRRRRRADLGVGRLGALSPRRRAAHGADGERRRPPARGEAHPAGGGERQDAVERL
ncbi:MAG: hypothetical protein AVDCRST_MAG69-1226, partial [uncultured Solirubrobacteraceae bacterium]